MKLRHKILGSFLIVLTATALVGWVSHRNMTTTAADFTQVNREAVPLLTALKDLRLAGLRLVATSMESAFLEERLDLESGKRQEAQETEELQEVYRDFANNLAAAREKMGGHTYIQTTFPHLQTEGLNLLSASQRFLELADAKSPPAELLAAKEAFETRERSFLAAVEMAHNQEREELNALEQQAFQGTQKAVHTNAGLVLFTLVLSLALGLVIATSISRRVKSIERAAGKIASGDLSVRLVTSSKDELGALSHSFNRMVDALQSSRTELASTNTYLDGLISAMMDGLMVVTLSGEIRDANPSCCRRLGFARQELLEQRFHSLHPNPSEGDLLLRDIHSSRGLTDREIVLLTKEGMEAYFILSASLLPSSEGESETFVCLLHDISLRKQAESRVLNLAYYDQLTSLPNRTLFMDRLDQAIAFAGRSQNHLALFFFDLDHFKNVNDTLGHKTGDQLLLQVAERMGGIMRKSDTLARLGGDEFILLCQSIRDAEDASHIAARLLSLLGSPFQIDGNDVHTGASIGIALYPGDGEEGSTLLRNVDLAMYAAKESGRQQYKFFSDEMNRKALERAVIEAGLRQAVLGNQLSLHYQPLIELSTGRLVGAEALCRWTHPELGPISPAVFIPVAEQIGVIRFLGEWVLATACRQGKAWKQAGRDLRIWVNVSAAQLMKPDFPEQVSGNLLDAGLEPGNLGLELTESMLMGTERDSMSMIKQLKGLGVALAIDDFGTGYSSLSYLKNFEVDKLKIDRSFVTDLNRRPDALTIVKAIIAMGHSLGMSITAEGIETEEEAQDLRSSGCDEGQGYLFAKPMDLTTFERFLGLRE